MKGPLFYSKILLFGEYGIIEDSKGLSIPYNFFNGALKISDYSSEESKKSNSILRHFSDYLKTIDINLDLNYSKVIIFVFLFYVNLIKTNVKKLINFPEKYVTI